MRPSSRKKFTSRVRPGSEDERARPERPTRPLIRLDLPTLERPAKAISGRSGGGSCSIWAAPIRNTASRANSTRAASISASEKAPSAAIALGRLRRDEASEQVVDRVVDLEPAHQHVL